MQGVFQAEEGQTRIGDARSSVSEDALWCALDVISRGLVVTGPNRRIVYCNPAFTEMTGFSKDEIVGKTCALLHGPDTDQRTIVSIRDALDKGERFQGQILNYRKNGEPFWNELSIDVVKNEAGQVSHFVEVLRDCTARRSAEAALSETVQRHRFLFDHMLAGLVVHRANTEIVYANATAIRMLGVNDDAIVGAVNTDPRWRFVRGDGSAMPIEEYPVNQAVARRSDIKNLVLGLQRSNGDPFIWLMCNAYPVLGADGIPVEVVVSFTDVTVLKEAERALQASEERFQLVLKGSNDAPWDWDLRTGAAYYSPRWREMLGCREDEPLNDPIVLLHDLAHPDDREKFVSWFGSTLFGSAGAYELEFSLRHRRGHYVPILSRGFILRDNAGRPIRISGTNMDLTERKAAEEQINRLAFYDSLTGLANRRLLLIQIEKAISNAARTRKLGAVAFLDLDNFKLLNDTLGHLKGDAILKDIALRIRIALRDLDTISRLGGDEFVVLFENVGDCAETAVLAAQAFCQRIMREMGRLIESDGVAHTLTASIGVAIFDGLSASVEDLLKQADLAMYHAKSSGKNQIRFFDPSMQVDFDRRVATERELRSGIEAGELELFYQPQVDAESRIIGAEALVRWRHPRDGLRMPDSFIAVAEATDLIHHLGDAVLKMACERLRQWSSDVQLAALGLAVNVSIVQLLSPGFAGKFAQIVQESGIDPRKLTIEITENIFASGSEEITKNLAKIDSIGVKIALDDFGTGYSSLKYLHEMPITELKIDKCFVKDIVENRRNAIIANVIINLTREMGIQVVAEGVETLEQRNFLAAQGCYIYQGYLFGRPVPAPAFEAQVFAQRKSDEWGLPQIQAPWNSGVVEAAAARL